MYPRTYKDALIALCGDCDFGCAFCFRGDRAPKRMEIFTLSRALSVLRELGISKACLTGGEPTQHVLFGDMVRLARQFGLSISLITAARSDNELDALKRSAHLFDHITFSADTHTLGNWTARKRPIRDFASVSRYVTQSFSVNVTFYDVNEEDIEDIRWLKRIAPVELTPLFLTHHSRRSLKLSGPLYLDTLKRDIEKLAISGLASRPFAEETYASIAIDPGSQISCHSSRLYISPTGSLRFCPYGSEVGNVFDKRQEIAWAVAVRASNRMVTGGNSGVCRFVAGCRDA